MLQANPGARPVAPWRHVGAFIAAVLLLTSVWSFLVSDELRLLSKPTDDAYYYCTIAANYAESGVLTFDGKTRTNGFHPLWLALLLPVFSATSDRLLALRLVGITSSLLMAMAVYLSWRVLVLWYDWAAAVFGFLLVLLYARGLGPTCMETSLVIALVLVGLGFLERSDPWGSRRPRISLLLLGSVALSMAQMARLDAVLLNVSIIATVAFVSWRRFGLLAALTRSVLLGAPIAATGVGYLIWNAVYFGHILPVSAMAKSLGAGPINAKFARQLLLLKTGGGLDVLWLAYSIMLILCLIWLGRALWLSGTRSGRQTTPLHADSRNGICAAAALFLTAYTAWYLFRTSWQAWSWYTYPAILAAALVAPAPVGAALRRMAPRVCRFERVGTSVILAVAVLALARSGLWAFRPTGRSFMYRNYEMALVLNERLGAAACLAMGDRAGSLGYFFEGHVLQLEGLVGSYEILDAISKDNLADYMTSFGVTHVVAYEAVPDEYDEWTLTVPSAFHTSGPKASIVVRSADEICRTDEGDQPLIVWRWSKGEYEDREFR